MCWQGQLRVLGLCQLLYGLANAPTTFIDASTQLRLTSLRHFTISTPSINPTVQIRMTLLPLARCQLDWGVDVLTDRSVTPPKKYTIRTNFRTNNMLCTVETGEGPPITTDLQWGLGGQQRGTTALLHRSCGGAGAMAKEADGLCFAPASAANPVRPNGGPCFGDGGSPFFLPGASAARDVVFGVNSFGPDRCGKDSYVMTDVAALRPWIDSTIDLLTRTEWTGRVWGDPNVLGFDGSRFQTTTAAGYTLTVSKGVC